MNITFVAAPCVGQMEVKTYRLQFQAALTFDFYFQGMFSPSSLAWGLPSYGLKVNVVSVAIVAMVNHTAIRGASDQEQTNVTFEDGPFAWSSTEQGAVLGSYFVGYLLTQVSNCHF